MSLTPTPSTVTQTVTILPGQEFVLPNGANIISIIASGDATAESDCTLPDLSEYVCSYFKITMANDAVAGEPMDDASTKLGNLTVGDTVFYLEEQLLFSGSLATPAVLNSYITDLGLFKFTASTFQPLAERKVIWLYFQTVGSLLPNIELQIFDLTNPVYFKPGPTAITCGETPNP
jgi:hypothetical protein